MAFAPLLSETPVVIVGMHRSGTSLIARLMKQLGMFTGKVVEQNDESPLFIRLNDIILSIAHASWDQPEPLLKIFQDDAIVAKVAEIIKEILLRPENLRQYLPECKGPEFLSRAVWGWKDPRTTITWPVWRKVFPGMKLIFVHRNGVDVARSLQVRASADAETFQRMSNAQAILFARYCSIRCRDIAEAFKLWEIYNSTYFEHCQRISGIAWESVAYENFLTAPEASLKTVSEFARLCSSSDAIQSACATIDSSRKYAFLGDSELETLYVKNARSPMMVRCGYENISLGGDGEK
jgi:hypothetical protein